MTQEEIKDFLADVICELMFMDKSELEGDTLFSDFGLESITLIKIVQKVNEKYGSSLEGKNLLAYQTLNSAAEFIFKKLQKSMSSL